MQKSGLVVYFEPLSSYIGVQHDCGHFRLGSSTSQLNSINWIFICEWCVNKLNPRMEPNKTRVQERLDYVLNF